MPSVPNWHMADNHYHLQDEVRLWLAENEMKRYEYTLGILNFTFKYTKSAQNNCEHLKDYSRNLDQTYIDNNTAEDNNSHDRMGI